jgi:hypothetical protein
MGCPIHPVRARDGRASLLRSCFGPVPKPALRHLALPFTAKVEVKQTAALDGLKHCAGWFLQRYGLYRRPLHDARRPHRKLLGEARSTTWSDPETERSFNVLQRGKLSQWLIDDRVGLEQETIRFVEDEREELPNLRRSSLERLPGHYRLAGSSCGRGP